MKKYTVKFVEVPLKKAVKDMHKYLYFYTYEVGTNLYPLNKDSLPSVVENDAIILTMDSVVDFK